MTDLSQLLEKVRTAEAGSIALDREIMCGPGGWVRLSPSQHPRNHKHPMFVDPSEGYSSFEGRSLYRNVPSVTTSLDAIVALIERELPGWEWRSSGPSRSQMGMCIGRLFWPETPAGQHGVGHYGDAATPALALSAAFLSALISKEKADG